MQTMVPLYGFGGVPYSAVRKAAPRNLLDNSDWRKPSGIVNQRGETTYSGNKYTIDRWRTYSGKATVTIGSGYLEITDALMQFLDIDPDMVYTAAVCKADGSVVLTSGTFRAGFGNSSLGIRCSYTNSLCRFLMESSLGNLAWAALYEGEYTADNLPVYQPKGYMTELAECQRYYQRVGRLLSTGAAATGFMFNNTSARFVMSISPMRKNNPTVNLVSSASKPSVISNGNVLAEGALTFTTNAYKDDQHLVIAVTVSGGTQYANAVLVSDKDCYFEISADL